MTRRHWSAPLLAALTVLAGGCGGQQTASTPAGAERPTAPLEVAVTDGRVGDATTADAEGLRQLARGARRTELDRLERRRRDGVGAGAACADADLLPGGENLAAAATATLCLVNGERADAGLPSLTTDARLAEAALSHSRDMVSRQYFAHDSLDGRDVVDRLRATGYVTDDAEWTVGENLAWGTGTLATPKNIVAAWMASPGHRANILRSAYRQGGLGIVTGNPSSDDGAGATYTMNYGRTTAAAQTGTAPAGTSAAGTEAGADGGQTATRPATSAAKRRAAARRRAAKRRAAERRAAKRKKARRARARISVGSTLR